MQIMKMTIKNKLNHNLAKNLLILISFITLCCLIVFVGCEIPSSSVNKITSAYNFPNPFCPSCETNNNTNIRVVFENNSSATKVSIEIKIVNIVNKLVWYFKTERAVIDGSNNIDVLWSGRNNEGEIVSQGVYDAKIIVQVLESSTNSGGDTLSTKVKIGVE